MEAAERRSEGGVDRPSNVKAAFPQIPDPPIGRNGTERNDQGPVECPHRTIALPWADCAEQARGRESVFRGAAADGLPREKRGERRRAMLREPVHLVSERPTVAFFRPGVTGPGLKNQLVRPFSFHLAPDRFRVPVAQGFGMQVLHDGLASGVV